jgi:uncharacterized surface protein with fasciclin (FAS1) repeats
MNPLHHLALATIVGGMTLTAMPQESVAQRMHTCAETLVANPNYSIFRRSLDRVRSLGALSQSQPVTIFALDNTAMEQIPPRIRNYFLPLGPEEGAPPAATMIVDQLVVEGIQRVADLKPGQELYTVMDALIQVVGIYDGKPTVRIGGYDMTIVAPDQDCRNGVIQGVAFVPRSR